MKKTITKIKLEARVWYRLLKVLYLGTLIYTIFSTIVVAYSYIPTIRIDKSFIVIECNNGHKYELQDIGIYNTNEINSLNSLEQIKLRRICEYGTSLGGHDWVKIPTPDELNYRFGFLERKTSSWMQVFKILIFGIGTILVIFEVLKRLFFYILLGKSITPPKAR